MSDVCIKTEALASGAAERDPALLNAFTVLTFSDLKKWAFYYWFAFPALKLPSPARVMGNPVTLADHASADGAPGYAAAAAAKACDEWLSSGGASAWLLTISGGGGGDASTSACACHPLTRFAELRDAGDNARVVLAFADPCAAATHPGWALRNLAVMASVRWGVEELHVLCVRRPGGRVSAAASLMLTLRLPTLSVDMSAPGAPCPPTVGWEANAKGRTGPRVADLVGRVTLTYVEFRFSV